MVTGTYLSTCGSGLTKTIKETRITGTGMVFQDKTSVDLTNMEALLSLSYSPGHKSGHRFRVYRTIESTVWRRHLGCEWCI